MKQTMFVPVKKYSRVKVKTVRETVKISEHRCTRECLRPTRGPVPRGLRRVSLGHAYISSSGSVYSKMDGEWLPVEGLTFASTTDGRLVRIFQPTVPIHIHSPGGTTIAKDRTWRNIKADQSYLAQEAAKKLKREGYNLRDVRNYLGAEARKVIPPAPKHRRLPKGSGRGAPGIPRSGLGLRILALMGEGKSERETLKEVVEWTRGQGLAIAGPHRRRIAKRVHWWYAKARTTRSTQRKGIMTYANKQAADNSSDGTLIGG